MLDKVHLTKVNLPLFDKYCLFLSTSLLWNLSSTRSHIEVVLKGVANGRSKYVVGNTSI